MAGTDIVIRSAREHNLRDVSLELPRGKLICFTGVSGSGKSSLAFDTLYAEGQRRYVESLSSYARQFLGQMPKPDVDRIDGLSPSIAIQQKTAGRNPRSTVGHHHRDPRLPARAVRPGGTGPLPAVRPAGRGADARADRGARLALPEARASPILAPVIRGQKGEYKDLFAELARAGLRPGPGRWPDRQPVGTPRARPPDQARYRGGDRSVQGAERARARLAEAVEAALKRGDGTVIVAVEGQVDVLLSSPLRLPGVRPRL